MDSRYVLPGTVRQGYLTKSPPLDKGTSVFKAWKKRWCILYLSQRELFIQYYENEDSARGSSPPKSTVSLRFCEKVDANLDHSHYKNVFGLYLPERAYYFSAPSNYDMNEWVDSICAHLNLNQQVEGSTLPHPMASGNHYISSPQFNTLPSLTPPTSAHYPPSTTLPVLNISQGGIYSTQGQYSCASQYGSCASQYGSCTSQYGSCPPSTGGGFVPTANYGTVTISRGPPPSPPPPYNGNLSDHLSPRVSPNASVDRIQQRLLPPIPMSSPPLSSPTPPASPTVKQTTPPIVPPRRGGSSIQLQDEEPPVPPPRQGSAVPNFYTTTQRI